MPTKTDKTEYSLYGGAVKMVFSPNATKYRYTVTDAHEGEIGFAVRGVTTVLRDIVAKPDLMTWPMNMLNKVVFGSKFDETTKEYVHVWEEALLKPDTPFTADELHNMMMDGSREWTKRSDKGKDVGTMTHDAIEAFLKDVEYPFPVFDKKVDPEGFENVKCAKKALGAFTQWWNALEDKEVLNTEKPVYSRGMKYAGTYDLLARINGKTYLLDVKTTNASKKAPLGIYAEYFMQLGGYSYAHREETNEEIDDLGIIRVGKDGKLHIATATDIGMSRDECERAFAFGVRVHDWLSKANPYLADVRFKSHLMVDKTNPSDMVDASDSVS